MERLIKRDPFFDRQPPLSFLEELKSPLHTAPPAGFGRREAAFGEANARGAYLVMDFPDPQGLLETAAADFRRFLEVCGMAGNSYPICVAPEDTPCFEAHRVRVSPEGCAVAAADTEGVRRGLIWLEDELRRREGPYLPLGTVERRPHIRARITRCFFSPINRPPKFGDELSDDIDYYPEEYLNRLAHDGANGLWIYTRFSDLLPSDLIPEYGKGWERRMEKLNRVIAKCARYGLKIYVFAIEPYAFESEELAQKYPQVLGSTLWNGRHAFCTNTAFGLAYCREATKQLFTLAPGLGGLISITMGERGTACASVGGEINCPHCAGIPRGQVLAQTAEALRAGMREASPDADFVSWTYGHRLWDFDSIRDYVRHAPDDVMLQQNFDDMGYEAQLGRVRQGVDYWLSYVGPSELFEITAREARAHQKHLFAKMQVCCSHEVASVPYIPAPGILFKKYAAAHAYGVEGVMQCWYFGNYPSLMSKAAGELAFEADFTDEEGFLRRLAGIAWGNSRADAVVRAWRAFEAGYRLYPLNVMFSYYGPMHDGPVWELQLLPKNFSLPRSWQTLDPCDGDRIGESLLNGHTLDEALTLAADMAGHWREGLGLLEDLTAASGAEADPAREEQISVARALGILFASGRNILEFYRLRDALGWGEAPALDTLARMRAIAEEEITHSQALSALCGADGRLGYHSEGEGYKFFPEKLAHRAEQLRRLLDTEFPEVEARVRAGLPPLAYYTGEEEGAQRYQMPYGGPENAPWEPLSDDQSAFRAAYDAENLYIELKSPEKQEFRLSGEFRLLWPEATVHLSPDGAVGFDSNAFFYFSIFGEEEKRQLARWKVTVLPGGGAPGAGAPGVGAHLLVTLDRKAIGWTQARPMKLRVATAGGALWCVEENPVVTLGKPELSPGQFGFLLP